MSLWKKILGSHPLSKPINRAGTGTDIDAHIADEVRVVDEIERNVKEALHMLKDIRRAEKGFKKLDDLLEAAAKEKRRIEDWYDQKIIAVRKRGDVAQERGLQRRKYWEMAKVNQSLYRSLKQVLSEFSYISEVDKRFEQANKLINQELERIANDVNVEVREELVEARA